VYVVLDKELSNLFFNSKQALERTCENRASFSIALPSSGFGGSFPAETVFKKVFDAVDIASKKSERN
jgi:hypothetical protein